jgi:hypothetical protein
MNVRWGWFKVVRLRSSDPTYRRGGCPDFRGDPASFSNGYPCLELGSLTSLGCSVIGFNSSYLTIGGPQDDLESRDFHRAAATIGLDHLGWADATTGRREEMALKPRDGTRAAMTGLETI